MIIIGYPGIGKTTLARKLSDTIDLESSSFVIDGERPDNWHIYYCGIAEDLSRQGNIVFVSSHNEVVRYMRESDERVVIIRPDVMLRKEWITKLHERYMENMTDKNQRAWERARYHFGRDICELQESGIPNITIHHMGYYLTALVNRAMTIYPDFIQRHEKMYK